MNVCIVLVPSTQEVLCKCLLYEDGVMLVSTLPIHSRLKGT